MNKLLVKMILSIAAVAVTCGGLKAQAPADDWQTLALWHLDSTVTSTDYYSEERQVAADDDSVMAGRGKDLVLGRRAAGEIEGYEPDIVTGGAYGSSLYFDGSDLAWSNNVWNESDTVKIEFYFKPDNTVDEQTIIAVTSSFEIRFEQNSSKSHGKIDFYVVDGSGANRASSYYKPISEMTSEWNYVVAIVDADGNVSVELEGAAAASDVPNTVSGIAVSHHPTFYIGSTWTHARPFTGYIDEVKISDPSMEIPAFNSPYADNYNTFLLYHCDEVLETSPRTTPDDDSANPGRGLDPERNLDGILEPASSAGETYTGPERVTSFGGDPNEGFKQCFKFDGFENIKVQGTDQNDDFGIDADNVRVELWAVHDEQKYDDGYEYYFFHQPGRFRFSLRDLGDGTWGVRFVIWDPTTVLDVTIDDPTVWNHYAFEFYQGTMKTIINGVEIAQKEAGFTSLGIPTRQLYIGSNNVGGNKVIGRIDEFKISRAVPEDPECGAWGYSPADVNQDCYVNDADLLIMAQQWLTDCTEPGNPNCGN